VLCSQVALNLKYSCMNWRSYGSNFDIYNHTSASPGNPAFYITKIITVFTTAYQKTPPRVQLFQSTLTSYFLIIQLNIILSFMSTFCGPSCLLRFLSLKLCMHFSSFPFVLHNPNCTHPLWFSQPNNIWQAARRIWLLVFLQLPVIFPLSGTNILLYSQTPSVY
jgi:hypothetical protein